jgi:hypothetical protein
LENETRFFMSLIAYLPIDMKLLSVSVTPCSIKISQQKSENCHHIYRKEKNEFKPGEKKTLVRLNMGIVCVFAYAGFKLKKTKKKYLVSSIFHNCVGLHLLMSL